MRRIRPALLGLAAAAVAATAVIPATGTTTAGFTDSASASVHVGGTYDIALTGRTPSGQAEQSEGNPTPLLLGAVSGTAFTTATPVVWTVTVRNTAAPGDVVLGVADPADEPFAVGQDTYPDLFSWLRFTIKDTSSGTTFVSNASAAQVAAASLALTGLQRGDERSLELSAVLDPATPRAYHGRTTAISLTFAGATS